MFKFGSVFFKGKFINSMAREKGGGIAASFFPRYDSVRASVNLEELSQRVSVIHPTHGKLYGPFIHVVEQDGLEQIIQNTSINLPKTEGELGVFAYFPDLHNGTRGDFFRVVDILHRGDLRAPNLIFYTKDSPQIWSNQLDGIEVHWPASSLRNGGLSVIPALSNKEGELHLYDGILISEVKKILNDALRSSRDPQYINEEYLEKLFHRGTNETLGMLP